MGCRVNIGALDGLGVGPVGATLGAYVGPVGRADGTGVTAIAIQADCPLPAVVIPAAQETQGGFPEGLKRPRSQTLQSETDVELKLVVDEPGGQI